MSAKLQLAASKAGINAIFATLNAGVTVADGAAKAVDLVKRGATAAAAGVAEMCSRGVVALMDAEYEAAEDIVDARILALNKAARAADSAYTRSIISMKAAQTAAEDARKASMAAAQGRMDAIEGLIG